MFHKQSLIQRFVGAITVAAIVVVTVVLWLSSSAIRNHLVTREASTSDIRDVARIAKTLGIRITPRVVESDHGNTAQVVCSSSDTQCTIKLSTLYRSKFFSENREAAQAVIAHELAHVLQNENGFKESHAIPAVVLIAFSIIVFSRSGWRWWLFCLTVLGVICGTAIQKGVLSIDDIASIAIYIVLVASCVVAIVCFSPWRKISRTSARVAVFSFAALVSWSSLRGFETQQRLLERDADVLSACAVNPRAAKAVLERIGPREEHRLHKDIYHPSRNERIAAISAFGTREGLESECARIIRSYKEYK